MIAKKSEVSVCALFNNAEKWVFVLCEGNLSGTVNTIVKCLTFYYVGLLNAHFYITMPIPILYKERRFSDIVESCEFCQGGPEAK